MPPQADAFFGDPDMKISLRRLLGAACAALLWTGGAYANDNCGWDTSCCDTGFCTPAGCDTVCDTGCDLSCDPCCEDDGRWGFFGEAELLFLRYHRGDGVRVGSGPGENVEFDFEPAGRYTAGISTPDGLGFRTRYFRYDRAQNSDNGGAELLDVNVFTVDFELFDTFQLSDLWAVEVSGGVRYTEFREQMIDGGEFFGVVDVRDNNYRGMGLVSGLEVRRGFGAGHFYTRTRGAVVQGDKDVHNRDFGFVVQDVTLYDTTHGMLEIAVGYEANFELSNGMVLFGRSGLEWQNWWNFSSAFDQIGGFGVGEAAFDGDTDVGFAGLTFAAGVTY